MTASIETQISSMIYIAPRFIIYALCCVSCVTIAVLWIGQDDWIKLFVILTLQWMSFEGLISFRKASIWLIVSIIAVYQLIYTSLIVTVWTLPEEPEPFVVSQEIEFNITNYGGCIVSHDLDLCYDNPYVWYKKNFDEDVDFQARLSHAFATVDSLRMDGMFNYADEAWESCQKVILKVTCGELAPMCDLSCRPMNICHRTCGEFLAGCAPEFFEDFVENEDTIIEVGTLIGIDEDIIIHISNVIKGTYYNCSISYAEKDEMICNSGDGYTDELLSADPGTLCTADGISQYETYLDSLNVESVEEYEIELQQYHEEYQAIANYRISFAVIIWFSLFVLQIFLFLYQPLKDRVLYSKINKESFSMLPLSYKVRLAFFACFGIVLSYMTRYTLQVLPLRNVYLVISYCSLFLSVFVACRALFWTPRIIDRFDAMYNRANHGVVEMHTSGHSRCDKMLYKMMMVQEWYYDHLGRNGKYEYPKELVYELVEVSLQLNVMLSLARTESSWSIMVYVAIISLNVTITPIVLMHPNPHVWRTLGHIVDSLLDLCYLTFLFVTVIVRFDQGSEVNVLDIAMGFIFPSLRLSVRLYMLTNGVIIDFLAKSKGRRLRRTTTQMQDHQQHIQRKGIPLRDCRKLIPLMLFSGIGIAFFSSSLARLLTVSNDCSQQLGATVWNSLDDHALFPNGLFSESSCNFQAVKVLNMSGNSLQVLVGSPELLSNVHTIDLSSNQLTSLPVELIELHHLQVLILDKNPVEKELDWSSQGFVEYPTEFLQLIPTLQSLNLSSNGFTVLPTVSSNLQSLTSLDLSFNALEAVPADLIASFTSLQELRLSSNRLTSVSKSIWNKESLIYFDISNNSLSSAPIDWGLRSSFVAHLAGNPIYELDWSWISGRKLVNIPEEISELTVLEKFTAENQAIVLYGGLFSIMSLREIRLANSVSHVADSMCDLPNLEYLDVSGIRLASPQSLSSCSQSSLKIVNLSSTGGFVLSHSRSKLFSWTSLEVLIARNLTGSEYTVIHKKFDILENLIDIDLSNSIYLDDFAESFTMPPNITRLNLQGTSFDGDYVELRFPEFDFDCSSIELLCIRTP